MVTPTRAIALLLSLAVLLAGPVSSLAALVEGGCCCTESVTQLDLTPAHSCCESQTENEPDQRESNQSESNQSENPGQCPGDCDCCVNCSAVGPPVQFNRPMSGIELPDSEPDTWQAFEPQSHAIEAHFSLLRPPRS